MSKKATRTAVEYFRQFMRANTAQWGEMMRGAAPNQGWGDSDAAHAAYSAAMFLYQETNEKFLDFEVPGEFASGADLLRALNTFELQLKTYVEKLEAFDGSPSVPMTLATVLRELEKAGYAVEEAKRLLLSGSGTLGPRDIMETLEQIAARFPDVVAQLAKRRTGRDPLVMTDEYDVQYLFQALLRLEFADVRPEETTPSVAGGSARADCLLKDHRTVIEFKMTRAGYQAKDLRKELADDFVLYAAHPDCNRLFAFIYDPGRHIANYRGVEADLSKPRPPIETVRTYIQQG